MAKTVGLYLGVDTLGVAVVSGRNLVNFNQFNLSVAEESKQGVVNEDVRLEASINKALREAGVVSESIYLSLADRDFIFRSLEMPLMRKGEIESSLVYEVEKYIPFKMTELEWTYASVRSAKEKKMNISFVGIRDKNLGRIRDILGRLDLGIIFIEPSSLSLFRALKTLKRFSKIKDFALLDITKTESHLTFFQDELPVFNRYLTIPKKEDSFDTGKFSESVDFSFQYFKREFRSYKLDKFILVSDIESKELASSLEEGLQVSVEAVSSSDIANRNDASVESMKAFGAAVQDQFPSVFKSSFRKTQISKEGEMIEIGVDAPDLRIGLIGALLGIGLVAAFFTSIIMGNEVVEKKAYVNRQREEVVVPKGLENFSWDQYPEVVKDLEKKTKELKDSQESFSNLANIFEALSSRRVLPEGLWLENFRITRQKGTSNGKVTGYLFRDDDQDERSGLDDFVSRLKAEPSLQQAFPTIEIDFSKRQTKKEFEVTYFSITLK
ncbi:MAG: hypothetical protein K9L86_04015 [Candidatus Omnitrophica bacterium]|nr:hypothetical protein [Candidatus Omnitrophota bacterium]